MTQLIRRMDKGFNIAVFEGVEVRPFAVYLGDCMIKSNLTFIEAEHFCLEGIKKASERTEPAKRNWMKEKREEMKLTIRGIAPLLNISYQHYSDIENGRKNPGFELQLVLADFFDVGIEKFYDYSVEQKKKLDEGWVK